MNDNNTPNNSGLNPFDLTNEEKELLDYYLDFLENLPTWDDEKLGEERRKLVKRKDEIQQTLHKLQKQIEWEIEKSDLDFMDLMDEDWCQLEIDSTTIRITPLRHQKSYPDYSLLVSPTKPYETVSCLYDRRNSIRKFPIFTLSIPKESLLNYVVPYMHNPARIP